MEEFRRDESRCVAGCCVDFSQHTGGGLGVLRSTNENFAPLCRNKARDMKAVLERQLAGAF